MWQQLNMNSVQRTISSSLQVDILPSVLWHCWLGVRKSIWPVKNWVMGCWCGYPSGERCRLFAYVCHCIPKPHHLLPHLNPDWFIFLVSVYIYLHIFESGNLAHRHNIVVLDKRLLNGCSSSVVCRATCVIWHPSLPVKGNGRFCYGKVLLPTCSCWSTNNRAGLRHRQTRQPPRASDWWGPHTGT